jgi:2-aminophenol/2-amino-5-chlorophenol 1,6-dioxygenase alpha subunit
MSATLETSSAFAGAALIPGMPQLLAAEPPAVWAGLADSARQAGERLRGAGAEALMVISTQWFTVLGHQVQLDERLVGTRVDENWYDFDYGTMHYDFRTDVELAEQWAGQIESSGLEARRTTYEHFPVDTGVILATSLLDPQGSLPVVQVSCNLYAGVHDISTLGRAALRAAEAAGRRVGMVAVSGLSSALTQRWIEPHEDHIEDPANEEWDRRILDLLAAGQVSEVMALREQYAREAQADSQLRALAFLEGSGQLVAPADVLAYGPIWGTGGAVVHWPG